MVIQGRFLRGHFDKKCHLRGGFMMSLFQKMQKIALFSMIFVSAAGAMEAPDTIKLLVRLNYQQEQEPITTREEKKSGSSIRGMVSARLGSGIRSLRTLGGVQRIEIEGGKNRRLGPILDEELGRHGCSTFHIADPKIKKTMTMEKVYRELRGAALAINCGKISEKIQIGIKLDYVGRGSSRSIPTEKEQKTPDLIVSGKQNESYNKAFKRAIKNIPKYRNCEFVVESFEVEQKTKLKEVEQRLGENLLNVLCFQKEEEPERQQLEKEFSEDIQLASAPPLEIRIIQDGQRTKTIHVVVDDTILQKILKENHICRNIDAIKIETASGMKRHNPKNIINKSIQEIRTSLMETGSNVLEIHCK